MPSQEAETATSGLAAVAVFRYRCVSLVRAGMAPKTWSLVQSVIHGRWSAEIHLGSRPRHGNWDDDPSWARNLRVGRDGKPSGACSVNVGDKEGSIAQNARFGATGSARVRDGDFPSRWVVGSCALRRVHNPLSIGSDYQYGRAARQGGADSWSVCTGSRLKLEWH